ncbi:MAG: hypothetical protein HRT93_03100 [Piscirickettsiaceae bacterium]|nr:hypothetical protein [Piscirickettsiaceae bacterium]
MIDHINSVTKSFVDRYNAHIMSKEGLLRRFATSPTMSSEVTRSALRHAVWEVSNDFAREESQRLASQMWKLANYGTLDDNFVDSATVTIADVMDSFHSQVRRDDHAVLKHFNDMSLRVGMMSRQRGWSRTASILAVKSQFDREINYSFTDRAGKGWGSLRYISTLVRGSLLNIYNESQLYAIAVSGKNKAYVKNANTGHKHHGMPFFITPTGEGQTYGDIRKEVFHPNSSSIVSSEKISHW